MQTSPSSTKNKVRTWSLSFLCLTGMTAACFATALDIVSGGAPAMAAPADLSKAIAKYNGKDYQTALNEFKATTAKDPNNALAHYYMALCNQCLARVGEAKLEYKWVVDHASGSALGTQAQAGLSQLEKVNGRTGGGGGAMTSTASAATESAGKSNDLIDRSGKKAEEAKGGTAGGAGKKAEASTKTAALAGDKVAKIINFYSDISRTSILMEDAWNETKTKYSKYTFQKVNAGDALCDKYGVSEFPTVVMLDKNGNILSTQGGLQTADQIGSSIEAANAKK